MSDAHPASNPRDGAATPSVVSVASSARSQRGVLDDPVRLDAVRRLIEESRGSRALSQLSELAARLLGADLAMVTLISDAQHVAAGYAVPDFLTDGPTSRDDSMCRHVVAGGEPFVVNDAGTDPRVADSVYVRSGALGAYLGVPLSDSAGQVVGALCALDDEPREWTDRDLELLEKLAVAAAAELERASLTSAHDTVLLRLSLAMHAAGIGCWDYDPRTDELVWDERLREMFGVGPGEDISLMDSFSARLHPDDRERVNAALQAALDDDVLYDEEYQVVQPDGRLRWVRARGRRVTDENGETVRIVGAAYETTRAHEAVASESLVALLAEAGEQLHGSLEVGAAAQSAVELVVPLLADWAMVSLVGDDGVLRDVSWWHRDVWMRPVLDRFAAHRFDHHDVDSRHEQVLATAEAIFVDSGAMARPLATMTSLEAVQALRELAPESGASLPLLDRGRVIGVLGLARGADRPPLSVSEKAACRDLARRASLALENARSFGRQRQVAEELQRSMLSAPVYSPDLEIVVRYRPAAKAAQVGGDWYDAFEQDGETVVVIGDVVGHDTASAAAMGQLRSLLRGIGFTTGAGPADLLRRVDEAIEGLAIDTTATAVVVRAEHDHATGDLLLRWSNAGHPPPVVADGQGDAALWTIGDLLLGFDPALERADCTARVASGSTLLLYTDGLFERRGEDPDVGLERLRGVVAQLGHLPPEEFADAVLDRMLPRSLDDDVALVALRRR